MSKLKDTLIKWSDDNGMGIMCDCTDEGVIRDLEPVLKALFLEIIGEDEQDKIMHPSIDMPTPDIEIPAKNRLRAELRQKVKEL